MVAERCGAKLLSETTKSGENQRKFWQTGYKHNAQNCLMSDLIAKLRHLVGTEHVLDQSDVALRASHYWNASPLQAYALVKPATTNEVSAVLRLCNDVGQSVVTQGGLTGLTDGEKSTEQDIILSLERMRKIESIDVAGRTITVQAGCALQQVQTAVLELGLLYGLDLGARGSCTIGGNIATNAGGLSVLRYGMTREQILGLEAVLADGTVLSSMNAMMKNNAGYDLKQLFIGSEGTLGVVTRAVLRLRPNTPSVNTALLAFDSFDQISKTLAHMSANLNSQLNAFEIIWNPFYQLATNDTIKGATRAPLARHYAMYAIVESQGSHPDSDNTVFMQALESAMNDANITDAVIAQSEQERRDIWVIRENVDLILRHKPVFIYDISLPIVSMESYVENIALQLTSHWPDVVVYAYGHLADSNLHIAIAPKPDNYSQDLNSTIMETAVLTQEEQQWYDTCNKIMFEPLTQLGGSVSAEHGIGLLKKSFMHYSRTPEEIATMKIIKRALDPNNTLNPGKVISVH